MGFFGPSRKELRKELQERIQQLSQLTNDYKNLQNSMSTLGVEYRNLQQTVQALEPLVRGKEPGPGLPLVISHSLPKTGSMTISKSLEATGNYKTHHHHAISDEGMADLLLDVADSNHPHDKWMQLEKIRQSIDIRQDIVNEGLRQDGRRPFFVSGVRDPVALFLSLAAQRYDLKENGEPADIDDLTIERLTAEAAQFFARPSIGMHHYLKSPDEWFGREIIDFHGINPFDEEFDSHQGYKLYQGQHGPVLIYRLEDLDSIFTPALASLIGEDAAGLQRVDANISANKEIASHYAAIKKTFVLPEQLALQIYSTAYARTFYTADERDAFVARWTKQPLQRHDALHKPMETGSAAGRGGDRPSSANTQLASLRRELSERIAKITEMHAKTDEMQIAMQEMTTKVTDMHAKMIEMNASLVAAYDENRKSADRISVYAAEVQTLQTELEQLRKRAKGTQPKN